MTSSYYVSEVDFPSVHAETSTVAACHVSHAKTDDMTYDEASVLS